MNWWDPCVCVSICLLQPLTVWKSIYLLLESPSISGPECIKFKHGHREEICFLLDIRMGMRIIFFPFRMVYKGLTGCQGHLCKGYFTWDSSHPTHPIMQSLFLSPLSCLTCVQALKLKPSLLGLGTLTPPVVCIFFSCFFSPKKSLLLLLVTTTKFSFSSMTHAHIRIFVLSFNKVYWVSLLCLELCWIPPFATMRLDPEKVELNTYPRILLVSFRPLQRQKVYLLFVILTLLARPIAMVVSVLIEVVELCHQLLKFPWLKN